MNLLRIITAWLCFLPVSSALFAQDVHLSQFFATPLMRNPALAGLYTGDIRLQGVYRNQWQSIGFPYQTSVISGEYKAKAGDGGDYITAGINCFYDVAGVVQMKSLQMMPVLNFHKSLSDNASNYLSAGFMAGFVQRSFNNKNLTFDNQYTGGRFDPSASSGENFSGANHTFFDAAVGLTYSSQLSESSTFYIGGSLWHFNKPKVNFLQETILLRPKWQLNAGYHIKLNNLADLKLEANYLKQGQYTETIAGGILSWSLTDMLQQEETRITNLSIGAGLLMRMNDAIIPVLQISYNHMDVNFSYDANTSQLKTASRGRGGFELGLSFRAFTTNGNSSLNSVRCPRF